MCNAQTTYLYMVSGSTSSIRYSVTLPTPMRCFSPRSMLYEVTSLPFVTGSFQVSMMVWVPGWARTEVTGPGLEGGVTQLPMALNAPTPALFNAWKQVNSHSIHIFKRYEQAQHVLSHHQSTVLLLQYPKRHRYIKSKAFYKSELSPEP